MNELLFLLHIATIALFTILFLKIGKSGLAAFLSLLAVLANLFLLKEIPLFGLTVCSSDAFAVGYLFALNLTQEFFGPKEARKTVLIASVASLAFLIFSAIHLSYRAIENDLLGSHFSAILSPMPRLVISSLASFLIVQLLDISLFAYMRRKLSGRALVLRTLLSLLFAEVLDTLLYSIFALSGQVSALYEVLLFSTLVKAAGALLVSFFAPLARIAFQKGQKAGQP